MMTITNEVDISSYLRARKELLAERVRKGMAEAAAEGRPTGIARLGYIRVQGGTDDLDPTRKGAILQAFHLALAPTSSLRGMVRELASVGLIGTRGDVITLSSLRHMLRDPYYAGLVRYKGFLRNGCHPVYVTLAEFNLIQQNMGWLENQIEHPYQE